MMLPTEDRYGYGKRKVTDDLCVAMGGRVAEELFLGDISSGASGDIKMATWYAKKMVCEWGMSGRMGMVEYGDHEDYVFLGREIGRSRGYSEQTAREIDEEVHQIVSGAYERAKKILGENRDKVEKIAAALLEYETLDGSQVEEIIKHGRILNPPPKGLSAPTAPTPSEPLSANRPVEKVKDKGTILPGLEGAPAGA
jgi:cell division protease FtsH